MKSRREELRGQNSKICIKRMMSSEQNCEEKGDAEDSKDKKGFFFFSRDNVYVCILEL